LAAYVRSALWWLVPLALLTALLAYETDFGRALRKAPPPPEAIDAKPVSTALLPDYAIMGGLVARRETVDRTLFTPTRRPAPEAAVETAKQRMNRGQFALTGTAILDGRKTAFLRETNGGRSRRVAQGETINGLVVVEVAPDRVKLAMGDESEELVLRVATNSKATPPAPVVAAAPPGMTAANAAPALPPAIGAPAAAAPADVAQTLAQRRRDARAAAAAQNAAPPNNPMPNEPTLNNPPAAATAAAPAASSEPAPAASGWNDVYRRYQNRMAR